MMGIALAVLLANGLYLTGIFDANPLQHSWLYSSLQPGPVAGESLIDPTIGYVVQPLGHLAATDWLHLRVPWWNPYEGLGMPLAGEMQSAAMFPPTLLLELSNGRLFERVLFELVGGTGTYLVLRRIGLGRAASCGAGVAFALNGTFAWLGDASITPVALLPVLLLGIEHAYSATIERRAGGWSLVAMALALSIAAGFPETAYCDGLLALLWGIWRLHAVGQSRLLPMMRKLLTGIAVGCLLAAPVLVAFLTFLPQADVAGHLGHEVGHVPFRSLPQLTLPYVYGPIFAFDDPAGVLTTIWSNVGGYLSMSIALFGLLGLVVPAPWRPDQRRLLRLLLGAWIALALCRVYGIPGLGAILGIFPGMSSVQFWRFSSASISFAAVTLAACGIDRSRLSALSHRLSIALALAIGALLALDLFIADGPAHNLIAAQHRYLVGSLVVGAAVAVAGILVLRQPRALTRVRLASLLIAIEAFGLFVVPEFSAARSVRLDETPVSYLRAHLGLSRFFTLGPLQPNYGSYFGLASLNLIDTPIAASFERYVHLRLDPTAEPRFFMGRGGAGRSEEELVAHLSWYQRAAVAYVLTKPGVDLTQLSGAFSRVFESPTAWIYHLSGTQPYFSTNTPCQVSPRGRARVTVSCTRPSELVRHELLLTGWHATIDGRRVPIARRGPFQAVNVPTGTHVIAFGFEPPGATWSVLAFAAGLAMLLLSPCRRRWSRQRDRRRSGATDDAPDPVV